MSDRALKITDLYKKYNGFTLDRINLEIEPGCVMGLVGQNGAGKTTIIKSILNGVNRNGGDIKVYGLDNIEDEVEVKKLIGYVADESYLMNNVKLDAHRSCFKYMFDSWNDDIFDHYVKAWNLPLDKKVNELSKGTQTKVMLALTLAHQPKILILDEPTAGLDPVARIDVLDVLRDFVSDGKKSVLFSTHITTDLDRIADYITIIIEGKIVDSMSIDKIEEKYAVISGDMSSLDGKIGYTVGVRKGSANFEALVKRENLKYFSDVEIHTPNIENLLTFSIWGKGSAYRENREG